jgi:hypothetical protein
MGNFQDILLVGLMDDRDDQIAVGQGHGDPDIDVLKYENFLFHQRGVQNLMLAKRLGNGPGQEMGIGNLQPAGFFRIFDQFLSQGYQLGNVNFMQGGDPGRSKMALDHMVGDQLAGRFQRDYLSNRDSSVGAWKSLGGVSHRFPTLGWVRLETMGIKNILRIYF